MKNAKRIFQSWAEANGMIYNYGQRSSQNLLDAIHGNDISDQVYFLHTRDETFKRFGKFGNPIGDMFQGDFLIVVRSTIDQVFFKEKISIDGTNKFKDNIEPLYRFFDAFPDSMYCDELLIQNWSMVDVSNLLDLNVDGILVRYTINYDN